MSFDLNGDYSGDAQSSPHAAAEAAPMPTIDFTAVMKSQPTGIREGATSSDVLVADNSPSPAPKPGADAPSKAEADPRVAIHDRMSQLYTVVEQEEGDAGKKSSWSHGVNLRELGSLYMQTGDISDGRLCLKAATEVFHQASDKPKDAEMTVTESLVDYGRSLLQAPAKEPLAAKQVDFTNADEIFKAVVDRAKLENRSPQDIAAMMQLKADADISVAETDDVQTKSGKAAYLVNMDKAMESLNGGINLLANHNGNDIQRAQARLHAELGYAETQVNKTDDRNNFYNHIWGAGLVGMGHYDAAGEYKQAIDLYHSYNPLGNKQDETAKDAELLTTLTRYMPLLDEKSKEHDQAQKEAQSILDKHPGWKIKM